MSCNLACAVCIIASYKIKVLSTREPPHEYDWHPRFVKPSSVFSSHQALFTGNEQYAIHPVVPKIDETVELIFLIFTAEM